MRKENKTKDGETKLLHKDFYKKTTFNKKFV